MGTVKYSGPVASFHCPTEATIRSLKVHFSPKQEGSGDPSPSNVRSISGWTGVNVTKSGKNLFNGARPYRSIAFDDTSFITSKAELLAGLNSGQMLFYGIWTPADTGIIEYSVRNGVFAVLTVVPGATYYFSGSINNGTRDKSFIKNNANQIWTYDVNLNPIALATKNSSSTIITIPNNSQVKYLFIYVHNYAQAATRNPWTIDDVINSWQVEKGDVATVYEPYHGSTTNYEFGVLGKNKFNWDVPVSESSPVASDAATAREFTLDTYVIGMSVNNYYRQNYAKWVLNPSIENGVISFSSGGASGYGIAFPLKLAAGQTYFLSGNGNGVAGVTYYNEDGELISYQNDRLNKTITVPENTVTTLIGFYANTSNTDFTFSNVQLELGSSATTYEPYNPNHTVYGGWVDLITGEVQEEQLIWTVDDVNFNVGNPDSYDGESGQRFSAAWPVGSINDFSDDINTIAKCNILPTVSTTNSSNSAKTINWLSVYKGWGYNTIYGCLSDSALNNDTSIENIKTYLKNNNFKVLVKLATPNTYHLAPAQLQTFLGQNNVWSNADYIEVEYDLHETQTILARKQFIIANQPHVVKPAAAPLQNFVTDMAAPLKSCKVYFSPVQEGSGDPSPDNVRPITGWDGIEIYQGTECYKLIPTLGTTWTDNGITIDYLKNGKYHIYGTAIESGMLNRISVENFIIPSGSGRLFEIKNDVTLVSPDKMYFYSPTNAYIDYWGLNVINKTSNSYTAMEDKTMGNFTFMVTAGTTYNFYIEPTFSKNKNTINTINWSDSLGTIYGGYLDLVNGEVVEEYVSFTLDGVNRWLRAGISSAPNANGYVESYNYFGSGGLSGLPIPPNNTTTPAGYLSEWDLKCNIFTQNTTITNIGSLSCVAFGPPYIRLYLHQSQLADVSSQQAIINSIKDWLIAHPVTITYKPIEKQIHSLTPQILKTLRGTNNIWSNANGNIELSYWKH